MTISLVDDGSTDDTSTCVAAYQDPRVLYLPLKRNVGKSAAVNLAVRSAQGEWLMFVDSDDRCVSNRLALQLNFVGSIHAVDATFARAVFVDENQRRTDACFPSKNHDIGGQIELRELLRYCPVGGGSLFVRRSAFLQIGGFDAELRKAEDLDFAIRFAQKFALAGQNDIVIENRISADGMMQNPAPESLLRLIERHDALFLRHAPHRLAYLCREAGDEFEQIGQSATAVGLFWRALWLKPNRTNRERLVTATLNRWYSPWAVRLAARALKFLNFRDARAGGRSDR
ncbi:glycosyltransferase family A protein [uncultured Salinisphaera sp.]|uniref:glycosyltransferase family 2 protein n=1 Tax=uncultured Salinisphaera sp. TaxID=359372 RepID=UPI0032B15202